MNKYNLTREGWSTSPPTPHASERKKIGSIIFGSKAFVAASASYTKENKSRRGFLCRKVG